MERDGLTEEAACKRMEAQMTNTEYVSHANVVFSTQWEPEYTQKQVMNLISDFIFHSYLCLRFLCRLRRHGINFKQE